MVCPDSGFDAPVTDRFFCASSGYERTSGASGRIVTRQFAVPDRLVLCCKSSQ